MKFETPCISSDSHLIQRIMSLQILGTRLLNYGCSVRKIVPRFSAFHFVAHYGNMLASRRNYDPAWPSLRIYGLKRPNEFSNIESNKHGMLVSVKGNTTRPYKEFKLHYDTLEFHGGAATHS